MNANKKMIQTQLTQETGKVILLKDLTNIATAVKQGNSQNTLMDKYGKGACNIASNCYNRKCVYCSTNPSDAAVV